MPQQNFQTVVNVPRARTAKYGIFAVLFFILIGGLYLFAAPFFSSRETTDNPQALTESFSHDTLLPASLTKNLPNPENGSALIAVANPRMGDPAAARLVIVEFGDFECPFCKAAFLDIREFAIAHPNEVAYVYRHFPLDSIHPQAVQAAIAAQCAAEQDKFWPYHDRLFQNQDTLAQEPYTQFARQLGLNVAAFTACMASDAAAQVVAYDGSVGMLYGVAGTPTFFVNGEKLEGVVPRAVWESILASVVQP